MNEGVSAHVFCCSNFQNVGCVHPACTFQNEHSTTLVPHFSTRQCPEDSSWKADSSHSDQKSRETTTLSCWNCISRYMGSKHIYRTSFRRYKTKKSITFIWWWTLNTEHNTFPKQTTLKKIVGAGSIRLVDAMAYMVTSKFLGAPASNHFTRRRKPAIVREDEQK